LRKEMWVIERLQLTLTRRIEEILENLFVVSPNL
jgi:hypothetical protein